MLPFRDTLEPSRLYLTYTSPAIFRGNCILKPLNFKSRSSLVPTRTPGSFLLCRVVSPPQLGHWHSQHRPLRSFCITSFLLLPNLTCAKSRHLSFLFWSVYKIATKDLPHSWPSPFLTTPSNDLAAAKTGWRGVHINEAPGGDLMWLGLLPSLSTGVRWGSKD